MSEAKEMIYKLRAAGVGGFLKTLDGRYLWIDSNAAAMLNTTPEHVVQVTDHQLFATESAHSLLKTDLLVSQLGRAYHYVRQESLVHEPDRVTFFNSKIAVQSNARSERLILGLAFSYDELTTPLNKIEWVESFLQQPHLVRTLLEMGPSLS